MKFRTLFALLTVALTVSPLFAITFSTKTYPTGNTPQAVVSADINRDGFPDLITADRSGFLTVLLGGSGGSFTISGNFPTSSKPLALDTGDFNNDGYPDVVALEDDSYQVFLSAHNGALTPESAVSFGQFGKSIVAVDLNGNHVPDLAITFCESDGVHCTLQTLLNDGAGHFAAAQNRSLAATFFQSLVAADFDRDSRDDLAVASGNSVLILHSNNNGTATLRQTIAPTGTQLFVLAAGDIDAKNGPDLVFSANPSCFPDCIQSVTAYEYLNNGSGTLSKKAVYTTNVDNLSAFRLADLTSDNRLDLIVLSPDLQDNNGSVVWAHYAGSGTFGSFATIAQLGNPQDMTVRDLNLDSRRDLAIADPGQPFTSPATVVMLNGSYSPICTPPSSANLAARMCSPTSSPSSRTFTVKGAGNSPTGVRRVELWVDGSKKYNSPDDRLLTTVTLSSGKHTLTIQAVGRFGATAKVSKTITVP